ncbi:DgyrCDS179 [Dimorphilus gyrociliatus]|uniref:Novel acetylcholine receptor chaperone n=1 Tax=Dimorphilus gyrociliatus TaxID=2664684 RepID=A0A7I8V6K7_9ANNE|nr:DgyrCDS179 [Dimorphilus gyrociliatus]
MANLALTVLSMTIGFFFLIVGIIKLSPILNDDIYKDQRKAFIKFVKVFPFYRQTGWKPDPHVYRRVIGILEVICGLILAVIPGTLKQVANAILLIIMIGALYTSWALKFSLDKMTPTLIFGLLLLCRLIVFAQVRAREKRLQVEAEKQKEAWEKKTD